MLIPNWPKHRKHNTRGHREMGKWCCEPLEEHTTGFFIHDLLADRRSLILGILAAPGGRETSHKDWGRSLGRVPGRPGPPRPPKSTISSRSKNHILKPSSGTGRCLVGPGIESITQGDTERWKWCCKSREVLTWFFIHDFLADRRSQIFLCGHPPAPPSILCSIQ